MASPEEEHLRIVISGPGFDKVSVAVSDPDERGVWYVRGRTPDAEHSRVAIHLTRKPLH